tara:strand:+ start:439 stop:888 length:450 start_codon:yes stop_codon:yes gene_type:complete
MMRTRIFKKLGVWSFLVAATLPFYACVTTAAVVLTPVVGVLMLVEHAQHGLEVSTHDHGYTRHYANGEIKEKGSYKSGRLNGPHTTYYKNGQRKSEGFYKSGKQEGLWKMWHEDGQKQAEVVWKKGSAISAKFWNRNGQVVDSLQAARK